MREVADVEHDLRVLDAVTRDHDLVFATHHQRTRRDGCTVHFAAVIDP